MEPNEPSTKIADNDPTWYLSNAIESTDDFNLDEFLACPEFQGSDFLQPLDTQHLGDVSNSMIETMVPEDRDMLQSNFLYDGTDMDYQFMDFDFENMGEFGPAQPATPPLCPLDSSAAPDSVNSVESSYGKTITQTLRKYSERNPYDDSCEIVDTMGHISGGNESTRTSPLADDSASGWESGLGAPDSHELRSELEALQLMVVLKFRSKDTKRQCGEILSKSVDDRTLRHRSTRKKSNDPDIAYNLEYPSDLTGHPCARGCRECLKWGINCSLLNDEEVWPCHACTEDDHDCELITAPAVKRVCERCKRLKHPCSFKSMFDQGEKCETCMVEGHHCLAGPAKNFIRPRLRYDWDWSNDPARLKKALRLLKDDGVPESRRHGDDFIRDAKPKKRGRFDEDATTTSDKLASQRPAKAVKTGLHDKTSTIITKLCHPIKFNHVDTTGGKEACHFCAEPSYSILGLAPREVKVRGMKNRRGLEELSGGHKADGVDNTRVCASCTLRRLRIIACPKHEIATTSGSKESANSLTALAELLAGKKNGTTEWCSICPSLAKYECCTDYEESRCGLRLCEDHMVLLAGVYDDDLQEMLKEIKDQRSKEMMLGLRADYELLKEDGLLMGYMLSSSR